MTLGLPQTRLPKLKWKGETTGWVGSHGARMSLLKSISVKGLLSYKDVSLDLRPLNVLIGPNASGKSNLIEVINLLQATPRDLSGFVRRSGGIS